MIQAIATAGAAVALLAACVAPGSGSNSGSASSPSRTAKPAPTLAKVFKDAHVSACMAKVLGQSADSPVNTKKAAALDSLSFPAYAQQYHQQCGAQMQQVQTLQGLEVFTGLRYLDVSSLPALSSLHGVSRLTKLEQINMYGTNISDISAFGTLPKLSQVALSSSVCDLAALKQLPLKSLSVACPTADISPIDGKQTQLYVHAPYDENIVRRSAQSSNTVTIQNQDGSFDVYHSVSGEVQVTHM
jgi:hypothetical protein